jgi:hypothetical protein
VTGWTARRSRSPDAIRSYLDDRYKAAEKRKTGEPYARNRDFVGACEEALVSFAFTQAGVKLDYISLEILRRWTRFLGVANFSYYVPGPSALRLWSTADLDLDAEGSSAPPAAVASLTTATPPSTRSRTRWSEQGGCSPTAPGCRSTASGPRSRCPWG